MSRVRFATAREVFEAFPAAREEIQSAPSEAPPLAYLKSLVETATPEDAVAFCAYVLPRREAVWWACQCIRALVPSPGAEEKACLSAAEIWVRDPEEHHRRSALQIGLQGDRRLAATWAALAAGWSGGSMIESAQGVVVSAPPELTAKAARIAVLTALARIGASERAARLRVCVDSGARLAGQ
jgi:hypothetical protein